MSRFFHGTVILPDRVAENGLVAVDAGKVTGVWDLESTAAPPHDSSETTRLENGYIVPGFVDQHCHGGGGADFMDGDPEAVATITATHARHGTTALLATTLSAPEEEILAVIRAVKAAPRRGAQVLGFHIEGPFLNPKWKGAQDPRYLRLATVAEIDRWMAAGRPDDRWHVTLAPEMEGAHEAIRHLVARGAVVSAGHTDCTYAQLEAAAAAGVSHVTHLYNGMRGLHHREPGTVGAALALPGMTIELIADGIHIHPASLKVAAAAKGFDRVILVTDAMEATDLPEGEYQLGELKAYVREGAVRLEDGTLAGSVLTMATAVRNMVRLVGVPLAAAVAMASLNPARKHGLEGRKGAIGAGYDADLVLMDKEFNVLETIVGGETVYRA